MHSTLGTIFPKARLLPVVTVHDIDSAVKLAQTLVAAGLSVFEITLRTQVALKAVREVRAAVPDAVVGVGTVLTSKQLDAVIESGAQFGVSPGATPQLLDAVRRCEFPFLPGVQTASDIMVALEYEMTLLKFFPAVPAGGIQQLAALQGPFPDLRFCPTGGLTDHNARDFLQLTNVAFIGGSWFISQNHLNAGNWAAVKLEAEQTVKRLF